MPNQFFLNGLQTLLRENSDLALTAKQIAELIGDERHYRWVGLYEVTPAHIGMIACTGKTPPAFPSFPVSKGLCGSAVALRTVVNVGKVQEDPRWLTTFGTTRSEIIVPVLGNDGRVIGLIDVESDVLNAFSEDDEQFLTHCARLLLPLLLWPRTNRFRVLFVCIGNACRSPMAEAIARHHASEIIEPSSAGLAPLGQIADLTQKTLLSNGYSVDHLSSKRFHRESLVNADLIINLAGQPRDRVFAGLPNVEDWNVEDPYGEDSATYQRILEEIESRVLSLAGRLRADRQTANS